MDGAHTSGRIISPQNHLRPFYTRLLLPSCMVKSLKTHPSSFLSWLGGLHPHLPHPRPPGDTQVSTSSSGLPVSSSVLRQPSLPGCLKTLQTPCGWDGMTFHPSTWSFYRVPISLNGTSIYPVPRTRRPGAILKTPSPSGLYPTIFSPVTFNLKTSFSSPASLPSSWPRHLQALAGLPLESLNWSSYIMIWPPPSSTSPRSCQGILPKGLSVQIWTWP